MEDKKLIDNLEEELKAALLEEGRRLQEEIENDESLKKYHVTEEMDKRMAERIRKEEEEREAYERLSEADKEALRLGRELQILRESEAVDIGDEHVEEKKPVPFKGRKRSRRALLLVAIVTVLVFAMGMTGIGGRPFILDFVDDVLGDRELAKVNSEQEEGNIYSSVSEEEKFYQEVEETFGCQIVKMGYTPLDMVFLDSGIEKSGGNVYVLYQCENQIVEYQMVFNFKKQSYGYDVEDTLIEERIVNVESVPINVKSYKLPEGMQQYVATFEYHDVFYMVNASIEWDEFEKIVKNFIFL